MSTRDTIRTLFLLMIFLGVAGVPDALAQSSTIAVQINHNHHPINPIAARGDVLGVEVVVGEVGSPVTDFFGVGFEVHYDPAQLVFDVLSVDPGPFLPAGPLETYVDNDPLAGIASFSVTPLGGAPGVDGFGTVLFFAFQVRTDAPTGPSLVVLADSLAINSEGVAIDLVAVGDSLSIFEAIVWPGDTDPSDCVVDQNDVLPLGAAWHQEGEARGFNLVWEAQGTANWATASSNEVNDAHVDATGDGRVSQNDLLPIGLNFGLPREGCTAAAAKHLHTATVEVPPVEAGASVTVALHADQPVEALLGAAFQLDVPPEHFRVTAVRAGALLDDGDLLAFDRFDEETGTLAAAFTRKGTHAPAYGAGTLVEIDLEALRSLTAPTVLTLSSLKLSDARGGDANPSVISLVLASDVATATEDEPGVPTHFRLYGAYPNPFNPTTTIAYDLPEAAAVTLLVYDLLGREVYRRLVGQQPAGAGHRIAFEAQGLTSGTYLYRVVARLADRQEMQTGRFVLMK